eukprot:3729836-Prymnesium_polylepis.1
MEGRGSSALVLCGVLSAKAAAVPFAATLNAASVLAVLLYVCAFEASRPAPQLRGWRAGRAGSHTTASQRGPARGRRGPPAQSCGMQAGHRPRSAACGAQRAAPALCSQVGPGPIPWQIGSEIFPEEPRAAAMSIAA